MCSSARLAKFRNSQEGPVSQSSTKMADGNSKRKSTVKSCFFSHFSQFVHVMNCVVSNTTDLCVLTGMLMFEKQNSINFSPSLKL